MDRHQSRLRNRRSTGNGSAYYAALLPVYEDGIGAARFGPSGSLNANEYDGCVNVNRNSADNLAIAYDNEGGRVADVVAT